jgi:peptide subunit release factor RF-3
VRIEEMPRFSPEHFARISVKDPLRRKHLDKGLRQLSEEGAAQVFYASTHAGPEPLVGAVGRLQFDVLLHRLQHEYGVVASLQSLPYGHARWVTGPEDEIQRLGGTTDRWLVYDAKNRPLLLFESEWTMRHTIERHDDPGIPRRGALTGAADGRPGLRHEEERGDAKGLALLRRAPHPYPLRGPGAARCIGG